MDCRPACPEGRQQKFHRSQISPSARNSASICSGGGSSPAESRSGWRYLPAAVAPPDRVLAGEPPPERMLAELRALGLI